MFSRGQVIEALNEARGREKKGEGKTRRERGSERSTSEHPRADDDARKRYASGEMKSVRVSGCIFALIVREWKETFFNYSQSGIEYSKLITLYPGRGGERGLRLCRNVPKREREMIQRYG